MAIEFIPAQPNLADRPQIENLIIRVRHVLAQSDGIIYYAWPQLKDYGDIAYRGDICVLTKNGGLKLVVGTVSEDEATIRQKYSEIAQLFALVEAQLGKSSILRHKRKLKVDIEPILFAPNSPVILDDDDATFIQNENDLIELLAKNGADDLTDEDMNEIRSILEGAKALSRPKLRSLQDRDAHDIGVAYADLEEVIANFDTKQRSVAMTALKCPQRIRGLAGTGKTVILAMKAALTHANDSEANILITYFTRSLKDTIERLVVRFYRHFAEGEPNWDKIHIRHGWGRQNLPGVYRDACIRSGISPLSYGAAKGKADPFGHVCSELIKTKKVSEFYDLILIDEGQDFPDFFYQLCFSLTKGERDSKQIIWAYDELQNVFDVTVRAPEALFGEDTDGEPRISLLRSLPAGADTNDHVLQKSYRNQMEVLVLAHALGFGVYGETVQMLENRSHWEDVGYDVISGTFETGAEIVVKRPLRNSPALLKTPNNTPLVSASTFKELGEEVTACVEEIGNFVKRGLRPHDILVIALDDRNAQRYVKTVAKQLALSGIQANNLLGSYDEPPFFIEDHVTLSTVYRAKGNEAAVVFVLGADAAVLRTRPGRNRLFVALTRTKGWLRISGFPTKRYDCLKQEITSTQKHSPSIKFTMPDMTKLNTIQRDLEEKYARMTEAKNRMDRMKNELRLSEDDMKSLIKDDDF